MVREMLGQVLEREFFDVVMCEDGVEALEQVFARPPDLVISDLMMPRIGGLELVKKLKETPSTASIPVLLLTAKDEVGSEVQGLDLGADDYLTKPVQPKLLLARVRKALQRARR